MDNITTDRTIIYSNSCQNANFTDVPTGYECFAKTFLKMATGGPAFLGNTHNGNVTKSPRLENYFIRRLYNYDIEAGHQPIIGVHEAFSKRDIKLEYPDDYLLPYSHNLFGDPSMKVWITPQPNYRQSTLGIDFNKDGLIPKSFSLYQNYPNPFNPTTIIRFDLPEATYVSLKIYDMMGREVVTLKDEKMNAGSYDINFNAKNISSGLYNYKIITDKNVSSKKMCLIK